jgi:hypothetical protein
MGDAQFVIQDGALAITIDLAKVPQIRYWQDLAERMRKQWDESEWFLGEARAGLQRCEADLQAVGEAYHALQIRQQDALAQLQETERQRDEANWYLAESRTAQDALRDRARQLTDELVQAQDTIDALVRSAQDAERRLEAERAHRQALESELAAVRIHGERRRSSRQYRPDVSVELQATDGTLLFRGPSRNVSGSGLSFVSDQAIDAAELVQVRLHFAGAGRQIEAIGRLAWQSRNGSCLVGCQLLDMPTGCLETLERILDEPEVV